MTRALVRDVMTTPAISVDENTPFTDLVAVLSENRISGVPVTDAGGVVVGVVSESDLTVKQAVSGDVPGVRAISPARRRRARERLRRAAGTRAADLMTAPARVTYEHTPLPVAARTMADAGVDRLPVVEPLAGRPLGIVTRSDLLSVYGRGDEEIGAQIRDEVLLREYAIDPSGVLVTVRDGVVRLQGWVENVALIPSIAATVAGIDGVVAVENLLSGDVSADVYRPAAAR